MRRAALAGIAAMAAALSACGEAPAPGSEAPGTPRRSARATEPADVVSPSIPRAPTRGSIPTPAPTPSPRASDSADAAVEVVRSYYAAIARKDYAAAWRMWDHGGEASGMTEGAFADSFAHIARYRAAVGTAGRIEPGAGQRYITIPVDVSGTRNDGGKPFRDRASVALHRVADVDGSSDEARHWHIHSIDMAAASTAAPHPPAAVSARYRCIDGSRLSVRFDNRADTATIARGGATLGTLAGQRPASGIWYKSERLELRGKGRDATFTEPGRPPLPCRSS